MKHFSSYIILLVLLFNGFILKAQNITGTWEGYMTGEFIQINIEQKGNELCGYTYDYELENKASHCVVSFEGRYEPEKKLWLISGKVFIENSGSHVKMRIMLWQDPEDEKNILKGRVYTSFMDAGDNLRVKKVASAPQQLAAVMPPCFPKPVKPATKQPAPAQPSAPVTNLPKSNTPKVPASASPAPKPAPVKGAPAKPIKPLAKQPSPIKKDTLKKAIAPVLIPATTQTDKEIVRKMIARKKTEQNRLEVNVKKINLKVYDNGIIDNDTVSIFYNGKLLLSHQRLSETPIEFNIDLDENISSHEIIMYAENLGSIPPNTALIIITAGGKRYELRSKANLEENAVLVIEYKPDQSF